LLLACALTTFLTMPGAAVRGQQAKVDVLRIGSSGTLGGGTAGTDASSLETLRSFIKDETGFNNEILRQKTWRELADKMTKGQLQIGVFQGYEFAWAQEEYANLKPLALAVNVYRYPVAYVVARRDDPAKDFAGLQHHLLALSAAGEPALRLFVDRQIEALGKKPNAFFSKITCPKSVEDALDDVVDGTVQATVADRAALEAYKKRKPGRFSQLKMIARSQPFPPVVVAYYDAVLDQGILRRFQQGLLNAGRTERGQTMLTLFRLTGFEPVPDDFGTILAQTRQAYPLPNPESKEGERTGTKRPGLERIKAILPIAP
jgi:ABC-type phosphate/phosphonate transport system substrate-binding protein